MTPPKRAPSRRSAPENERGLSNGEYVVLVLILASALVGTAILISWLAEQRGMIPAGSRPAWWPAGDDQAPDLEQLEPDGYAEP